MNKKKLIVGMILVGCIISLCYLALSDAKTKAFGIAYTHPTNSSTTTMSVLPVMVLDDNPNRKYAIIQNDSDTVIYLHLGGYFATASAASTTVAMNEGFRLLPAAANSFEIVEEGLYTGQVWATSSAASKKIIYIEK